MGSSGIKSKHHGHLCVTLCVFWHLLLFFYQIFSFRIPASGSARRLIEVRNFHSATALFGTRQRAWAKGDLSDKDIFEDEDSVDADGKPMAPVKRKLQPEIVF